jgi:hypothetical protein
MCGIRHFTIARDPLIGARTPQSRNAEHLSTPQQTSSPASTFARWIIKHHFQNAVMCRYDEIIELKRVPCCCDAAPNMSHNGITHEPLRTVPHMRIMLEQGSLSVTIVMQLGRYYALVASSQNGPPKACPTAITPPSSSHRTRRSHNQPATTPAFPGPCNEPCAHLMLSKQSSFAAEDSRPAQREEFIVHFGAQHEALVPRRNSY